jgi:hypothetical protein
MAKQASNTFGAMSSRLRSLGFIRAKRGESLVYTYPNGGPVILLPAYKSGEAVKPIHQGQQAVDGCRHFGGPSVTDDRLRQDRVQVPART